MRLCLVGHRKACGAGLRRGQPSEAVCHKVEELDLHLAKMSFRSAGRELNLRGGEAFKRLLRCFTQKVERQLN